MAVNESAKFCLGQTVATPAALNVLARTAVSPVVLLDRHLVLDQGDLCDDDHQANVEAVATGGRVFSSFVIDDVETKIWVLTEADRSFTTILTPDDC